MRCIVYNKLVRDYIPEIIESSGKFCTTETLSAEELADLLEVIRAAVIARGYTIEDLEQVRAEKAAKRGGFEKRILLKEVYED